MRRTGIYITDHFIRIAYTSEVRDGGSEFKELQIDISSLNREEIPSLLSEFLKNNKIVTEDLVVGISRSRILVKYISVPSENIKEIRNIVEHKLKDLFPYAPEDLVFDTAIIKTYPDGYSLIIVAAVSRDVALKEVLLLEKAGLTSNTIEVSAISLFNLSGENKKDYTNFLLVNLEDGFLDIAAICEKQLSFSRGIKLNSPVSEQSLIKEVTQAFRVQEAKGIDCEAVVLSGRGLNPEALTGALREALGIRVDFNNELCTTKGLILADTKKRIKLNLLPEEFKVQKARAGRKRIFIYFISFLILNVALIANIVFLKLKEKQEYFNFLKSQIRIMESRPSSLQEKILKLNILKNYSNSGLFTIGLLTELYRLVPEGIYLNSLEMDGGVSKGKGILVAIGWAENSKRVLKFSSLIKDSPLFGHADINYMKKQKSASGEIVDFEIRSGF